MIRKSRPTCRSKTARNSSTTGTCSPSKAVPPATDEQNHSSALPGSPACRGPRILAQPGSSGGHARISSLGGTRVSVGRQRTDRPGLAPAFHEDHVRLVSAGRLWSERLPPPGGENPAVRQSAGKLHSRRAAILRNGDADARQRSPAGGKSQ